MTQQTKAQRIADELDAGENFYAESSLWFDRKLAQATEEAATELRRLHDLLGKANALCRIRAERIKELEGINAQLLEALENIASTTHELRTVHMAEAAIAAASDETSR